MKPRYKSLSNIGFSESFLGKGTPNRNLACFVCYLKIIKVFGENNVSILKQIVLETQKWH